MKFTQSPVWRKRYYKWPFYSLYTTKTSNTICASRKILKQLVLIIIWYPTCNLFIIISWMSYKEWCARCVYLIQYQMSYYICTKVDDASLLLLYWLFFIERGTLNIRRLHIYSRHITHRTTHVFVLYISYFMIYFIVSLCSFKITNFLTTEFTVMSTYVSMFRVICI